MRVFLCNLKKFLKKSLAEEYFRSGFWRFFLKNNNCMTPFGHLSTAFLISRNDRYFLPAALAGSVIMDADIILLPFGIYNGLHRVITHNLFFLVLTTGLVFLIWRKSLNRNQIIFGLITGMVSHMLLDCVLDDNPTNGLGIAIFWPFSDFMFCPYNFDHLFPENWGASLFKTARFVLIRSLVFEIPVIIGAVMLLILRKVSIQKIFHRMRWQQR